MRKSEPRVHHMLDLIGGMQPGEKTLVLEYAGLMGIPVPRVIAQACREFLSNHENDLRRAQDRARRLQDLEHA